MKVEVPFVHLKTLIVSHRVSTKASAENVGTMKRNAKVKILYNLAWRNQQNQCFNKLLLNQNFKSKEHKMTPVNLGHH